MKILIVFGGIIPVKLYGGTQRVIWGLGKSLSKLGHQVGFLVKQGSFCDFAKIIPIDETKSIISQIPQEYDVIHFNGKPKELELLKLPYIITMHGNLNHKVELDRNTVFVSKNHASRFNSTSFVLNGLDWSDYDSPNLKQDRNYFHFLGKAAWKVKNVKGAIDVVTKTKFEQLKVLGGVRFNFKMGVRLTFSTRVSFEGMIGGKQKNQLLNASKGFIFPVRWHEPFGLAITESLYYGCPVFGTPYGSLPELVNEDVGFLSNKESELREAILDAATFSPKKCYEYANDEFNSKKMALAYLNKYEKVISNQFLNESPPKLIQIQEEKFLEWKK